MAPNLYWRLFNFVGKVFGGGLVLVGLLLEISNMLQFFNEDSPFNTQNTLIEKTFLLLFPLLLIFFGWLIIKAKPFNPKI